MSKIIIENKSDLSDIHALKMVQKVVSRGRVSKDGTQYCYLTVFNPYGDQEYLVSTGLNKVSDRFTITGPHPAGIEEDITG